MNIGEFTMWLGLLSVCLSTASFWFLRANRDSATVRLVARAGFIGFAGMVTVASVVLMYHILTHDFVYSYVARYSSRTLPLQYLVSSFWAGQEGSFLLWVLLGAWLGLLLMFRAGDAEPEVMLTYNLNNIFLVILLIKQSPFTMVPLPPSDGQGLNMLLQDPWMVIHPPVVFLGYAAFTIPFAYAVSALWRREYDQWIRPALPWTAFAFVSLGAGIIIGGYWSYKVLGWGGYWGWDPVENASLLPWLAGMALMHGMILQQTRRQLRKTNFALAAFSFLLVIYCTFLTRSGVLADFSVHSFTDLGITGWLVFFMAAFILLFGWFFGTRINDIPESKKGESLSYFSREFGFMAAMILLCMSAIVTGLGTSAPLITRVLEKASKVDTSFYNRTNLPLAVLILILLSIVPLLGWGRNLFSKHTKRLVWAAAGAIVAGAVILIKGYQGLGVLLLALFGGSAAGLNLFMAVTLVRKRVTLSSGAVAHLGVGLMFIGIVASSVYDSSEKILLPQDGVKSALGYEITLQEPKFSQEGKGMRLHFPMAIKKEAAAEFAAKPDIYSEKQRDGQMQRFVHPHIERGLLADLYISPVDFEPGDTGNASAGNSLVLKKGEAVTLHDYKLEFTGFDVSGMMGKKDAQDLTVGVNITASYKGEQPVILKPVIAVGQPHSPNSRVKLPGPVDAYLTLSGIDAGSKTAALTYDGPESAGQEAPKPNPPALIAEVSIKPGMTVLWLGTFLILLGGAIGIVRRA